MNYGNNGRDKARLVSLARGLVVSRKTGGYRIHPYVFTSGQNMDFFNTLAYQWLSCPGWRAVCLPKI